MRNYDKVRGKASCPLCLHTQASLSCGNVMRDQTPMLVSISGADWAQYGQSRAETLHIHAHARDAHNSIEAPDLGQAAQAIACL